MNERTSCNLTQNASRNGSTSFVFDSKRLGISALAIGVSPVTSFTLRYAA